MLVGGTRCPFNRRKGHKQNGISRSRAIHNNLCAPGITQSPLPDQSPQVSTPKTRCTAQLPAQPEIGATPKCGTQKQSPSCLDLTSSSGTRSRRPAILKTLPGRKTAPPDMIYIRTPHRSSKPRVLYWRVHRRPRLRGLDYNRINVREHVNTRNRSALCSKQGEGEKQKRMGDFAMHEGKGR